MYRRGQERRHMTECVLLLQNVFSYYRMCSLTTECVLRTCTGEERREDTRQNVFSYYRMCSLTTECVLLRHKTQSNN
jgi:hypothetical protein